MRKFLLILLFFSGLILAQNPSPKITKFDISAQEINLGETIELTIYSVNNGGTSDEGSISVSFPSLTGSSDKQYVSKISGDGDTPGYFEKSRGKLIYNKAGNRINANYLLCEQVDNNWENYERNKLTLSVKPQKAGDFWIYVRSTMGKDGKYYNSYSTNILDQQDWSVNAKKIVVKNAPPVEPPLPKITKFDISAQEINLGETIELTIYSVNNGGTSDEGSISVSFPSLTGSSDKQYVSKKSGSSDVPGYFEKSRGEKIYNKTGNKISANYLLCEQVDNNWTNSERNKLTLSVTPQKAGNFWVYVRSTMGKNGKYYNSYSTNFVDQQNWSVNAKKIIVKPNENTKLTVTVKNADKNNTPKEGVIVVRKTPSGITDKKITNSFGQVKYTDVIVGQSYSFEAYYEGINPFDTNGELWANASISIKSGSNSLQLQRDWPFIESIKCYQNGQELTGNTIVKLGEKIEIAVTIRNNSNSDKQVKPSVILDDDKLLNWEFDEDFLTETTVRSNEANIFPFYFTPTKSGKYYKAAKVVTNPGGKTDSWNWVEAFTVGTETAKAIIVTVDGLDLSKIFTNKDDFSMDVYSNYLGNSIIQLLNSSDYKVEDFPWHRNPDGTADVIEELKIFLKEKYSIAKNANAKFIVLGHSWGTVLAYSALHKLDGEIKCDLFITLSTPLGSHNWDSNDPTVNFFQDTIYKYTTTKLSEIDLRIDRYPQNVGQFVNYWAKGDLISGYLSINNVFSIRVDPLVYPEIFRFRNPISTYKWHDFTKLLPENTDNTELKSWVKAIIEDVANDIKPAKYLSLTPETKDLNFSSGSFSVSINSNTTWQVQVSKATNWLTVSSSSGNNDGGFTVNYTENNSTTSSRNATITVSGSDVENKTIAITQNFRQTCIQASLPTDVGGATSTSVEIPITVSDLTGENIVSYQFDVTYNNSVLRATSVNTTGTLSETSGWSVVPNTGTSGKITIGGFGANALSNSGELIKLVFNVVGTTNEQTNLTFSNFEFNSGTPCAETQNGLFTVVDLGLCGDADCNERVTAYDAAITIRYAVNLITEFPCALGESNADVDENNKITAFDAANILRKAVGLAPIGATCFSNTSLAKNGNIDPNIFTISQSETKEHDGNINMFFDVGEFEKEDEIYSLEFEVNSMNKNSNLTVGSLPSEYIEVTNKLNNGNYKVAIINASGISSQDIKIVLSSNRDESTNQITFNNIKLNNQDFVDISLHNLANNLMIKDFELSAAYPNPFNPSTNIVFAVPMKSEVTIQVYNMLGEKVKTLLSKKVEKGKMQITWDATNDFGEKIATGNYIITMRANDFFNAIKVNLIK